MTNKSVIRYSIIITEIVCLTIFSNSCFITKSDKSLQISGGHHQISYLITNSFMKQFFLISVRKSSQPIHKIKTKDLKRSIELLFEPMKHKINQIWTCLDCPTDDNFFLPFDFPHVQGKDVFQILSAWENEGCQEGHEKKPFLNPDAECFFFSCEFGVTANLEQILQFQEKSWKIGKLSYISHISLIPPKR